MLSKRKTLDEGSLLSSKSETQHNHRFTSTPYVPMDPGIGPLFNSSCVQIVLVFVCIKWINIYIMHTFQKNTLKASKSYIQERKRNKREPTKEVVMILHEIRRPNSLKIVPSGVANSRNLLFGGRRRGDHGCVFHGRKMRGVATNVYSRKTSEKPEKVWSTNFNRERFESCFYARERY